MTDIEVIEEMPVETVGIEDIRLKIEYGEDEDGNRFYREASRGNKKAWEYGEWRAMERAVSSE